MQPRAGMKSTFAGFLTFLSLSCLLALPAPAFSQAQPPGFAKQGGYVGISVLPNFTFDGVTFDGESIYREIDGEEIVILPRLGSRNLVRFALGFRGRVASLEVSYDRTHHDGTFGDGVGKAVFQAVNIDGRYFFLPTRRVQPFLGVGGSMPFFNVKDGSYLDPNVADAKFKGYGVNTEGGVMIYAHRQLGISVGYNYRVLSFDQVTGVSDTLFDLKPRFRETSGTVVVTGHVIF